jgi:hypothetical protein
MRTPIRGSLNTAIAFLVVAGLSFAQGSTSVQVPNGPASNTVAYGQAPAHRQAVPGTINYVEGSAMLNGQVLGPSAAGYSVAEPNQSIETQAGFVEVLLTPGAFLRIGHNSQVSFDSLGLANLQFEIVHGSATVEVADLVKGTTMQVNIGDATTQIEKRGLYEFDADQRIVRVLDGKAKILEAAHTKTIDKGDQIVLSEGTLKAHSFDKHVAESDPLYVWTEARSREQAEANVAVAKNVAAYGGWYGPGWYWDPFWAQYAFLPGAGFLYSPFGWGFYSPAVIYAAPAYRGFYGARVYRPGFAVGVHGAFRGGRGR